MEDQAALTEGDKRRLIAAIEATSQLVVDWYLEGLFLLWGEADLTMGQFKVLLTVHWHGGLTMRDLAGRVGMHESTLTRVVDRMLMRDLLTRERDPQDQRLWWVRPSPLGRRMVYGIPALSGLILDEALQYLDVAELRDVLHGQRLLHRAIRAYQQAHGDEPLSSGPGKPQGGTP